MTIGTPYNRKDYVATTGQKEYAYDFLLLDATHLEVYVGGVKKTLTTDYTLTGVLNPVGGLVTLKTAPTAGTQVSLVRDVPIQQTADYTEGGRFAAEVHERALDRLTMIAQQLADKLNRTPTLPASSQLAPLVLPGPQGGYAFRWNPAGTALELINLDPASVPLATLVGYTMAGLPAAGVAGRLARVTDDVRGVWMDDGDQWWEVSGGTLNVKHFGAKGDGVKNDTVAIQAAFAAAAAAFPYKTVVFPPGAYLMGNVQITKGIRVIGRGAKIVLTGNTGSPIGIELGNAGSGDLTGLWIEGLYIVGDGTVGHLHYGIYGSSGTTLRHVRLLHNRVEDVEIGISINADLSGTVDDVVVGWNRLKNIVGTASGQGYGIHHANGSGSASNLRVVHNVIDGAQRHSIYQGRGSGVKIHGNVILNHRSTVADLTQNPAINVSRSKDVAVTENTLINCFDGHIAIEQVDLAATAESLRVAGNHAILPGNAFPVYICGTETPSVTGYPKAVVFEGNLSRSAVAGEHYRLWSGKNVTLRGNTLVNDYNGLVSLVSVRCEGEAADGTAYSDGIHLHGNHFINRTGSTIRAIQFLSAACAAGSIITVGPQTYDGSFTRLYYAASVTNDNLRVLGALANTSIVGNVNTGEDDLLNLTGWAQPLVQTGDTAILEVWGTFANNTNNKRIRVYVGTTALLDTSALAVQAGSWMLRVVVERSGSASQRCTAALWSGNATMGTRVTTTNTAETFAADLALRVTAEATNDNDVLKTGATLRHHLLP